MWQNVSFQIERILTPRLTERMIYRWNQVDPQSATVLKWLIGMLCMFLFEFYWRSHTSIALTLGLCTGVLIGQIIPPRLSLGRLIITVSGVLAVGIVLTMLHR